MSLDELYGIKPLRQVTAPLALVQCMLAHTATFSVRLSLLPGVSPSTLPTSPSSAHPLAWVRYPGHPTPPYKADACVIKDQLFYRLIMDLQAYIEHIDDSCYKRDSLPSWLGCSTRTCGSRLSDSILFGSHAPRVRSKLEMLDFVGGRPQLRFNPAWGTCSLRRRRFVSGNVI